MRRWPIFYPLAVFSCLVAGAGGAAGAQFQAHRAVYLSVPYLDKPVSPAAAAVIRIVRKYEPRLAREDFGQTVALDNRYARAAKMAVARYERAADKGFVMAHYNLARALADGRGVPRDFQRARESFRLAATAGNVPAMLRLAEFYMAGLGMPKDRVEAEAYYYVAASLQNEAAIHAEGLLAPHLSQIQLEQVRARARGLRDAMPRLDLILQRGKEQELLKAAAEGDLKTVETLINNGVDANAINALGRTAIITAAWRGHDKVVRSLLDAGVEIDASDNQGRTALSWAAINGYPKIVDLLLAEAALVDVRDHKGLTPLIRAAWNGHEKIVAALIAGGADIEAADDRGITALQRAEAVQERGIVSLLRSGPKSRPAETIVLLTNDDGRVGALALLNQTIAGKKVVLNKAGAMFNRERNGTVAVATASQEFLDREFGKLLQDLPAPRASDGNPRPVAGGPQGMSAILALLGRVWWLIAVVITLLALVLFFSRRGRR